MTSALNLLRRITLALLLLQVAPFPAYAATVEIDVPSGDYVWASSARRQVLQITPIDVATGASNSTIITASGTNKIRIIALTIMIGNIATNVNINSKVGASAATAISPTWEFGANGGIVLPSPAAGVGVLPDSAAGANVTIVTSGSAASTHITGQYILLP